MTFSTDDRDDLSTLVGELRTKIQSTSKHCYEALKSLDNLMKVNAALKTDATLANIEQYCQEKGISETWVKDFFENGSAYTDPTTKIIDCDKACESLRTCYDQYFLKCFGFQMLTTLVYSLFLSFNAWRLINSFIIPDYEAWMKRTGEKLNECAEIYIYMAMVELETLNAEHLQRLSRAQELLTDIKDAIEFITNDIKNKVAEAKRLRYNSYFSAVINVISTVFNGLIFRKIESSVGENSNSGIFTKLSFVAQAGCTLGDIIHGREGDRLVETLQKQLQIAQNLRSEYERLVKKGQELSKKPTAAGVFRFRKFLFEFRINI